MLTGDGVKGVTFGNFIGIDVDLGWWGIGEVFISEDCFDDGFGEVFVVCF